MSRRLNCGCARCGATLLLLASETEHVIEAEAGRRAEQPVIAEEPAGGVANDDIGVGPRIAALCGIEHLGVAPKERARAWDGDAAAGDLAAGAVVQNEVRRARGVPGRRSRVDEMAERVEGRGAEAEEEPRRQARRPPGIGLRLALVGQRRVENMGAEARLGGVAAVPRFVAEEGMEPAIRLVPRGEVVDELDMAPAAGELLRPQHLVGRKRERAEA